MRSSRSDFLQQRHRQLRKPQFLLRRAHRPGMKEISLFGQDSKHTGKPRYPS